MTETPKATETTEKREFEVSEGKKYIIENPNSDNIRKSDWHYSKVYNESLVAGITTRGEMMDILKKRGLIGDEFDTQIEALRERIGSKIIEMNLENDSEKRRLAAVEVSKLRNELFEYHQRVEGPLANTCEQIAENARIDFLTSSLIRNPDSSAVWDSYDSFVAEEDFLLAQRARMEVALFLQGLDSDFLEKTPEAEVLRELADKEVEKVVAEKESDSNVEDEGPKKPVRKKRVSKVKPEKETVSK